MKRSSFIFPFIIFGLITFLLLTPGNELPDSKLFTIPGLDKIVHICFFFLLTVLFCRPFKNASFNHNRRKQWFTIIVVLAILYGIAIEFIQKHYVPFRSFEGADIVADSAGTLLGWIVSRRYFAENKSE